MRSKQLPLNIYLGSRGGRRPGSGRKRIHSPGVAHRSRPKISFREPMHINFKFTTHVRNKQNLKLLKKAIMNARSHGLKISQFALQSNHVHLIVEAKNNEILTKGMRSLTVTFAKGLKLGKVQMERYHLHILKTIREAQNAIKYVMFNKQKHEKGIYSKIDEYSSVLSQDFSLKFIQDFARKMKMTLLIGKAEFWIGDSAQSFILKKAYHQLLD